MKSVLIIGVVSFIALTAFSDSSKSEIIAIYDMDSVQLHNERCTQEHDIALRRFIEQKQLVLQQEQSDRENPERKKDLDKAEPVAAKVGLSTKQNRKQLQKDSIYLYDSVDVKCRRRVMRIAGDFCKVNGYKLMMTKEEYKSYTITSNGAISKTENVTKQFAHYANLDTIVRKY